MPVNVHGGWPNVDSPARILEVFNERKQYITDTAACTSCGATQRFCDLLRETNTDPTAPEWLGCCASGTTFTPCHHVENVRELKKLMDELAAGEIRTVAEAYPPPVQGPKLPSYDWLLYQDVWWYPHRCPAIRIAEMEKTHRFNTARWLERKAARLHLGQGAMLGDAPDDVWASWQNEDPVEWLRSTPLMKALRKGLPKEGSLKEAQLSLRAQHWHTCPMRLSPEKRHAQRDPRLSHGAPDECACITESGRFADNFGGRVIGATNDPASLERAR